MGDVCENCGLPSGAYSNPGQRLTVKFLARPNERWKRDQRRTVWVCGSDCALQTRAISAMGLPTHKWPLSLKEFASQLAATGQLPRPSPKSDPLPGQTPSQTYARTRINSDSQEGDFQIMGLPPAEQVCDANSPRKGGRPRASEPRPGATRMRRYRERQQPDLPLVTP